MFSVKIESALPLTKKHQNGSNNRNEERLLRRPSEERVAMPLFRQGRLPVLRRPQEDDAARERMAEAAVRSYPLFGAYFG